MMQFTSHAKRAAEEAGRSMQAGLSKSGLEITTAGKNTWEDITKSAKKGILKVDRRPYSIVSRLHGPKNPYDIAGCIISRS